MTPSVKHLSQAPIPCQVSDPCRQLTAGSALRPSSNAVTAPCRKPLHVMIVLLLLLAIGSANGWHLMIVQGYGWLRMVSTYNQSMPLPAAIDATLNGIELCGICEYVKQGYGHDSDSWNQVSTSKLLPLPEGKVELYHPTARQQGLLGAFLRPTQHYPEPLSPPPIS